MKVAEAMGAQAIRVTKMEEVENALRTALSAKGPVLLDCWIDPDLSVFPMVPAGESIENVFDEEDGSSHSMECYSELKPKDSWRSSSSAFFLLKKVS